MPLCYVTDLFLCPQEKVPLCEKQALFGALNHPFFKGGTKLIFKCF